MEVYQLDQMGEPPNGPVQLELEKVTGMKSVPQVFVGGKFIGDGSKIEGLQSGGTLKKELEDAGGSFK